MARIILLQNGQQVPYELTTFPIRIGRHPDCNVQVHSNLVSRFHAQLVQIDGKIMLEHLASGNGSSVNGKPLEKHQPHPLHHNDRIKLGPIKFRFEGGEYIDLADSDADGVFYGSAVSDSDVVGVVYGIADLREREQRATGPELFEVIAQKLQRNHVHCPNLDGLFFLDESSHNYTLAMGILRSMFGDIVILDARMGQLESGEFSLDRFFKYSAAQMAFTYGLDLEEKDYHPEVIAQILKDEPRSLFVFLNVDLIPIEGLQRLRGFTQEQHQVLYCGAHPQLGIRHETV